MDGQCGHWTNDCRKQNQLLCDPLTCLMTSVPSLEGVVAWSLSESSTIMVFADSVSPLLSLLRKPWGYLMSVTRPALTSMQKNDLRDAARMERIIAFFSPTQPGSPRPRRWTPLPPPGPPPHRLPRRWCPTPHSRRSSR